MKRNSLLKLLSHIIIFAFALTIFWLAKDVTTISCNQEGECVNEMSKFPLDKSKHFILNRDFQNKEKSNLNQTQVVKSKKFYLSKDIDYKAECKLNAHLIHKRYESYILYINNNNGNNYKINHYNSENLCLKNAHILNTQLLNQKFPKKVKLPNERKVYIIICLIGIFVTIIDLEANGYMPETWYKLKLKLNNLNNKNTKPTL